MDRRAFAGLMIIETMLAFGNTFALSFNMIYLFNEFGMELWFGPIYLAIGWFVSLLVTIWMSWKPHLDPRNAMLMGIGFLLVEYGVFFAVKDAVVIAITVGLAFGLFYPLFWTPFNILMAQMTKKEDRGVLYGAFFFVWPLATFIAPLLGGLVIGFANYQTLFGIGIVITVATGITIFAYRNYIPRDQVMRIRLSALGKRNVIAVLGEGGFEGVFWTGVVLVAYYFSTDEVSLGAIFSLFGLSAGAMAIILGKVSDRIQNRRFFVSVSTITSIPCIVLVYFAGSMEEYGVANGLLEFASFVFPVLLFAILTDKLEERKNDSVLSREYLLDIGRFSGVSAVILMLYLGLSPQECFLLAIPFLLMGALCQEQRKGRDTKAS